MDKYTAEAIEGMLCRELDDIVRHGIKSHQDLDDVKDMVSILKHLEDMGLTSKNEMNIKRYNSYDGWGKGDDSSTYYTHDDVGGKDSSHTYGPYMMRGYNRTGSKEEILEGLHQMVKDSSDEMVKSAILDCISKMEM